MSGINWVSKDFDTRQGFLSKYKAFFICYDLLMPRDADLRYLLEVDLCGIDKWQGYFESPEAAMEKAESVLQHWLKNTGLEFSEKEQPQ